MKKLQHILIIIGIGLSILSHSAQGQTIGGYNFETGIDPTLWQTLTNYDSITYEQAWSYPSHPFSLRIPNYQRSAHIGFDFFFCNRFYRKLYPTRTGAIHLDSLKLSESVFGNKFTFSEDSRYILAPFAHALYFRPDDSCHLRWQTLGTPGERIFVCEFAFKWVPADENVVRKMQVILREEDQSVTYIYGPDFDSASLMVQIGLKGADNIAIYVNSRSNTARDTPWHNVMLGGWPDEFRYYKFTPENPHPCGTPGILRIPMIGGTRANVIWSSSTYDSVYTVEYRPAGGSYLWTTVTTHDTVLHLTNLMPETDYDLRILTYCTENQRSVTTYTHFRTRCLSEDYNYIIYEDLYNDSILCRHGTINVPDNNIGPFDTVNYDVYSIAYGPSHSVVREEGVYDSLTITATNPGLLKVPPEHCASVRMGDNMPYTQESITYSLEVDTSRYDLLILRYALVEEDPSHPAEDQPQFYIRITDSVGHDIDPCYFMNFISGSSTQGWLPGNPFYSNIVWRDWSVFGIDLAPLHGQRVWVRMNNRDCARGAHFGYAYYTLESNYKRLRSAYCGDNDTNIFYAPKGFNYRWFKDGNTAQILGTADSLVVTTPGTYTCYASYIGGAANCGFNISITHGPRYPKALFNIEPINNCNETYRFVNNSVVAQNSDRTILTSEPCEDYLWRFDDGSISTEISPTHTFGFGTHTVELVATLAGGQCRDSISITFTNIPPYDTIADEMCNGLTYNFHGHEYTETGEYSVTEGCSTHTLQLTVFQQFEQEIVQTICEGQELRIGDSIYNTTGFFHHHEQTALGCDSSFLIDLTVRPMPSRVPEIFQSCDQAARYYYLKDSFTPADSQYCAPESITLWDDDSLLFRWKTSPSTEALPTIDSLGILHFSPERYTTYQYTHYYPDEPHCWVSENLHLTPVQNVIATIDLHPAYLEPDKLDFTAHDVSTNSTQRQWFINNEPHGETSEYLRHTADPTVDSILIGLIASNNSCADTTESAILMKRINILFPNTFTPTLPTNNTFGPVYHDIADYEIWIYDRRGDLVFHTTDINQHWDGTHNGTPCRQETYVYSCFYTTKLNDKLKASGTVTLLR